MKKVCVIAGILLLGLYTGCGQAANENTEDNNLESEQGNEIQETDLAIESTVPAEDQKPEETEKKVFEPQIYWSVETEEYQVCLRDLEPGETQQLLFIRDDEEFLLNTFYYDFQEIKRFAESLIYNPFEDIMGCDGFYIGYVNIGQLLTTYYAVEEEGVMALANSWCFSEKPNDYILDTDGDGVRELVCNVVWGDGYEDVVIYDYEGEQIRYCNGTDLLDEEYDNTGIGSQGAVYLPKKNVIQIYFWKSELGDYVVKDYKLNLEEVEWYPYSPN